MVTKIPAFRPENQEGEAQWTGRYKEKTEREELKVVPENYVGPSGLTPELRVHTSDPNQHTKDFENWSER